MHTNKYSAEIVETNQSMTSHLSCRVGMGGVWELLDRKIWKCDLSFRWEWEWDGNGNEVIEMGGNWYEKCIPAPLYSVVY